MYHKGAAVTKELQNFTKLKLLNIKFVSKMNPKAYRFVPDSYFLLCLIIKRFSSFNVITFKTSKCRNQGNRFVGVLRGSHLRISLPSTSSRVHASERSWSLEHDLETSAAHHICRKDERTLTGDTCTFEILHLRWCAELWWRHQGLCSW